MKKRLVLKQWVKDTLVILGCILVVAGCLKALQLQDQHEYEKAMKRCNNHIVEHYTSTGDKYYSCVK